MHQIKCKYYHCTEISIFEIMFILPSIFHFIDDFKAGTSVTDQFQIINKHLFLTNAEKQ